MTSMPKFTPPDLAPLSIHVMNNSSVEDTGVSIMTMIISLPCCEPGERYEPSEFDEVVLPFAQVDKSVTLLQEALVALVGALQTQFEVVSIFICSSVKP